MKAPFSHLSHLSHRRRRHRRRHRRHRRHCASSREAGEVPLFGASALRHAYTGRGAVEPGWSWILGIGGKGTGEGAESCVSLCFLGAREVQPTGV
jgi:hypothetical protein